MAKPIPKLKPGFLVKILRKATSRNNYGSKWDGLTGIIKKRIHFYEAEVMWQIISPTGELMCAWESDLEVISK